MPPLKSVTGKNAGEIKSILFSILLFLYITSITFANSKCEMENITNLF